MKNGINKMSVMLKELAITPMSYGQIQGFLFKLDDDGTYDRSKLTKNGHPRGYNCTNLALIIANELIEKAGKEYVVTPYGKLLIENPYKRSEFVPRARFERMLNERNKYCTEAWRLENSVGELNTLAEELILENAAQGKLLKRLATNEFQRVLDSDKFDTELLFFLKR